MLSIGNRGVFKMYEKEKQQIQLLENKIAEYEACQNLNEAQTDLLKEMKSTVSDMKMSLPQGSLTLQNGLFSGQDRGTGSSERATAPTGRDYRSMFNLGRSLDNAGFKNFNEFLTVLSSGKFDNRLMNTASETVPSDGGLSVPDQFAAWLLDASLEEEIVRPRATVWPMKSETLKVPGFDAATHTSSLYGGLTGTWIAELGISTEVFAKLRQIQLSAKKLACYTAASNELVADGVDYERQIQAALVKTIAWYLDYAFIQGTGAGQPLGIVNDPALITVTKETGQKASTVVFENCVKMYARLAPQCMNKAVWLASQTTVPQLLTMSLAVGTGGAPIQPAVLQENGKFSLLGKPVIFSEKIPALGSLGQLMLVDLSQYTIGMRKEISLDKSIHPGWTTDTASYRAIVRADGQGSWDKAITPKAGDSLSWCVALAA
jgi:HK97 family phage major capsid protein